MVEFWAFYLVIVRVLLLGLGIATTAISFRAYRRTRTRYLRDATLGFAVLTIGVFIEGALYQIAPLTLAQVHIVESVAIGLGFVILLRSFLQ